LGVYDEALAETLANVLKNLGSKRAMVVHGKDGLDEITTTDETFVAELAANSVKTYAIKPEDFGLTRSKKEDLKGGDARYNAQIAGEVLGGAKGPKRDIVLINAGAAICVTGLANTLQEGIKKAAESVDSGFALKKLEGLIQLTRKL
jgi:anthranilate phosphoribosyltransferase